MYLDNTSAISHCDLELVTINVDRLAASRQMAKGLHHQSANGINFFIAEVGAVGFVEVFNRGQRADRPGVAAQLTKIDIFFFIVFVFDFTDDKLKDVFMVTRPETPPNSSITIAI
nr:Uncharacterised protein [Raoultella sp. NCTC 9187]